MKIAEKLKSSLKFIIIGVAVVALGVGGFFGWQSYQYRQSAGFLRDQLLEALKPGQTGKLKDLVDLNTVFRSLASAVALSYPFIEPGPGQVERIAKRAQAAVFEKLEDTSKPGHEMETDPDKITLRPLVVLPPDFGEQMLAGMQLQPGSPTSALLAFNVKHPQLEDREFQMMFSLRLTGEGWRVTDLANAKQLAASFRNAQLERLEAKREIYAKKNRASRDTMNATLPIESCTASTGLLSDGRSVLTVVHLLARNKSRRKITSVNVLARLDAAGGREILHRNLNVVQPIQPGEDFEHRWTIDMTAGDAEADALLAAPSLVCRASWYSMGVGGNMLYDVDIVKMPEDFK